MSEIQTLMHQTPRFTKSADIFLKWDLRIRGIQDLLRNVLRG